MKLQQLRFLRQVVESGLNISEAARVLHTSQPGVSKQLKLLEEELGTILFVRGKNSILAIAEQAKPIIELADRIVADTERLRTLARRQGAKSELSIATSHTLAKYLLPRPIANFICREPGISVTIRRGDPMEAIDILMTGEADIAVSTENAADNPSVVAIPCYRVPRVLIVPPGHPLLRKKPITLDAIAACPMIAYGKSFTGRQIIDKAFAEHGLQPNIVLNALGVDLVKTCVENGLGIAVITRISFNSTRDKRLRAIDVSHLFDSSVVYILVRKESASRPEIVAFIQSFAPHLCAEVVRAVLLGDLEPPAPVALRRVTTAAAPP